MNWLSRFRSFLASFRGEPMPEKTEPLRPPVTPDPADAAALERRFSELAYSPESAAFHRDQRQERKR